LVDLKGSRAGKLCRHPRGKSQQRWYSVWTRRYCGDATDHRIDVAPLQVGRELLGAEKIHSHGRKQGRL
jgi:hypothetical protein